MIGLLGVACGVAIIAGALFGGVIAAALANATRHEPDLVVRDSQAVPEVIRHASEGFQKLLEDFHHNPAQNRGLPPTAGFGPLTSEQRFLLISKHLEDLRHVAGVVTKR